jgi:hypothetical protein
LKAVDQAVTAGFSLEEVEKEPELRGLQADPRYRRWLQQKRLGGSARATRIQQEEKDVLQARSASLSLAVAGSFAVLVGTLG